MAVHGLGSAWIARWIASLRSQGQSGIRKDGVGSQGRSGIRNSGVLFARTHQRLCEERSDVAVHGLGSAWLAGWIASLRSQRHSVGLLLRGYSVHP